MKNMYFIITIFAFITIGCDESSEGEYIRIEVMDNIPPAYASLLLSTDSIDKTTVLSIEGRFKKGDIVEDFLMDTVLMYNVIVSQDLYRDIKQYITDQNYINGLKENQFETLFPFLGFTASLINNNEVLKRNFYRNQEYYEAFFEDINEISESHSSELSRIIDSVTLIRKFSRTGNLVLLSG